MKWGALLWNHDSCTTTLHSRIRVQCHTSHIAPGKLPAPTLLVGLFQSSVILGGRTVHICASPVPHQEFAPESCHIHTSEAHSAKPTPQQQRNSSCKGGLPKFRSISAREPFLPSNLRVQSHLQLR